MTTTAIRERLHNYISTVNDDKIKNIYALFEDQMAPEVDWSEDKDVVAELDERYRRWEQGIDKGITIEELEASFAQARKDRANR